MLSLMQRCSQIKECWTLILFCGCKLTLFVVVSFSGIVAHERVISIFKLLEVMGSF